MTLDDLARGRPTDPDDPTKRADPPSVSTSFVRQHENQDPRGVDGLAQGGEVGTAHGAGNQAERSVQEPNEGGLS